MKTGVRYAFTKCAVSTGSEKVTRTILSAKLNLSPVTVGNETLGGEQETQQSEEKDKPRQETDKPNGLSVSDSAEISPQVKAGVTAHVSSVEGGRYCRSNRKKRSVA